MLRPSFGACCGALRVPIEAAPNLESQAQHSNSGLIGALTHYHWTSCRVLRDHSYVSVYDHFMAIVVREASERTELVASSPFYRRLRFCGRLRITTAPVYPIQSMPSGILQRQVGSVRLAQP